MKKIVLILLILLVIVILVRAYTIRYEIPIYDIDQIIDYENFTQNLVLAPGVNISGSISASDVNRDIPSNCSSSYAVFGWNNNISTTFCYKTDVWNNTDVTIGDLNVTGEASIIGNVTAENVFLPQYIFSHTNASIPVIGLNEWTNVTFAQEDADLKQGISHTATDGTNHTFTIMEDGIYSLHYDADIEDTSESSTDIDVAGRFAYTNGTEIFGSVHEVDIIKKGVEVDLTYPCKAMLYAGDSIIFQFVATDADVHISTHGTFGEHPESASIIIEKTANLP